MKSIGARRLTIMSCAWSGIFGARSKEADET
jgi:hypothetical protein